MCYTESISGKNSRITGAGTRRQVEIRAPAPGRRKITGCQKLHRTPFALWQAAFKKPSGTNICSYPSVISKKKSDFWPEKAGKEEKVKQK